MIKKNIHIIPHFDKEAAGPSYSVPRLCQAIANEFYQVRLFALLGKTEVPNVKVKVFGDSRFFSRIFAPLKLVFEIQRKVSSEVILHNHSLWSPVNILLGWILRKKAYIVVSPRGTLADEALKVSALKKKVFWFMQKRILTRASLIHATSEAEYQDIRSKGFEAPVAIIPNGIDLPLAPSLRGNWSELPSRKFLKRVLFLGRIHPIKGLDNLLKAWAELDLPGETAVLTIAGVGEGNYVQGLKDLSRELNISNIEFVGPVYGAAKSELYFESDLFILPSYSENFGVAVGEALAHGCPVIVGKGAPWAVVTEFNCGWWINNDRESLKAALTEAFVKSPEELMAMGRNGVKLVESLYDWVNIGEDMREAYEWLTRGGKPPKFVRLD